MKKLFFLAFLLAPAAALADVTFDPGGSGSVVFGIGGSGSVSFSQTVIPPTPTGSVGNSNIVDSNTRLNNQFVYSSYTATAGQISYCHARVGGISTASITVGVYALDGTVLAYTNSLAGTSAGWYGGALNTSLVLTAQPYILGVVTHDVSWSMYKDNSEPGSYRRRITMTYSPTLSNADFSTSSPGYATDSETNAVNIFCDDTAATP